MTSTWASGAVEPELELVAVVGDEVVGHVMAARGDIGGREAVAVAPLAVGPSHQGKGIGSALMIELLRRAEAAGLPLIVLLGNPGYYERFGFEASGPLGITYRPVGEGSPNFLVRRLAELRPLDTGVTSPTAGRRHPVEQRGAHPFRDHERAWTVSWMSMNLIDQNPGRGSGSWCRAHRNPVDMTTAAASQLITPTARIHDVDPDNITMRPATTTANPTYPTRRAQTAILQCPLC